MDFNKSTFLIVSFSCLLLHTNAASIAPLVRVYNLCKPTTSPARCVKTISARLKGPFDSYKALEAEVLATKDQVLLTSKIIDTLLAKPQNKDMADSLKNCKDQYDNMIDAITDTLQQLSLKNVIESRYKFAALMSYHGTCNDQFDKQPSPIAADAKAVYDLGGNCLDIMKAIEDKELRRIMRRFGGKLPPPPPSLGFTGYNPCAGIIGSCS